MLNRFVSEYPQLAAALAKRYAALDDGEVGAEDGDVIGIGLWITENMVGEPLVLRDGGRQASRRILTRRYLSVVAAYSVTSDLDSIRDRPEIAELLAG